MSAANRPSQKPKLPPLELPPDLEIEYVNLARIAHTPSELIFDFAQIFPGGSGARISSRIIMSPLGAMLFYRALTENIKKYETTFGKIKIPGDTNLADHLFRQTKPPTESEE